MSKNDDPPDEYYDTDFLKDDWYGSSFDLACAFIFERDQVTANKLIDFTSAAIRRFPLRKLGVLLNASPNAKWTWIGPEDVDASVDVIRTLFPKVPIWIDLQLDDPENPELWFFFWFDSPDEFSFGAVSEYYFSGSKRGDRRRAENISELAFLAFDQFGSAWAYFEEADFARKTVAKNKSNNLPPNITSTSDQQILVKDILNVREYFHRGEIEISSGFIYSFKVGATVRVVAAAPDELRPGAIGTVGARARVADAIATIGIRWRVGWLKKEARNEKIVAYSQYRVEFADGSTAEINEDFLEEALPDRS